MSIQWNMIVLEVFVSSELLLSYFVKSKTLQKTCIICMNKKYLNLPNRLRLFDMNSRKPAFMSHKLGLALLEPQGTDTLRL